MQRALTAGLVSGLLLVTGCGGSPSPEEVASDAVSGLSAGDGQKVCAQLTEPAKRKLLAALADDPPLVRPIRARSCEEAITKVHAQLTEPIRAVLRDGEVDDAQIDGDRAIVHVTGAGVDLELRKIADEWKITDGLLDR